MSIIINPGSEVRKGSFKQAMENAKTNWLNHINKLFPEVVMSEEENYDNDGRWRFNFTHTVTGKTCILDIHGLTNEECSKLIFQPKVYWNGSSCSSPEPDDWAVGNYEWKYTYYKVDHADK